MAPARKSNLYERMAVDMRSKAIRADIQFNLNQEQIAKNVNKPKAAINNKSKAQENRETQHILHHANHVRLNKSVTAISRQGAFGGHDTWVHPIVHKNGLNQWEGAQARDLVQYRNIEKHAKEVDLIHKVVHEAIDKKEKAANFND